MTQRERVQSPSSSLGTLFCIVCLRGVEWQRERDREREEHTDTNTQNEGYRESETDRQGGNISVNVVSCLG